MMRIRWAAVLFLIFHFSATGAQQLVLPGDHADPSVVRIGDRYWAAGTTSNWFPAFPLYQSEDLIHWEAAGHVFTSKPDWVDHYMWAPEISYDKGKVYMYYTARKKGGSLCIAAAVADRPEGPYTDLGPLICQEDGSIDAFAVRDEKGVLYMIWKEDGNSKGKPTPIWAAKMREDRRGLIGAPQELFRADQAWEKGLVEGVSILRHGDYFYALYAGAACCGRSCSYGTGVARSRNLLGPWEKYAGNPVLSDGPDWTCPGHGTPVMRADKFFYLYHGYSTQSRNFGGRQGLLNEFAFTKDGWLRFSNNTQYGKLTVPSMIKDDFPNVQLATGWHWSIFRDIRYKIAHQTLELEASPRPAGAHIGQAIRWSDYGASVTWLSKSTAASGLALIGDDNNILYAAVHNDTLQLIQVTKGKPTLLAEKRVHTSSSIKLKLEVRDNSQVKFYFQVGKAAFQLLNRQPADISQMPPWDRAIRVGLIAKGNKNQSGYFKAFSMYRLKG
ncbi:glycoside hydrolase family 43 protein [Niabella terrae]